jgi:hypothetical protein
LILGSLNQLTLAEMYFQIRWSDMCEGLGFTCSKVVSGEIKKQNKTKQVVCRMKRKNSVPLSSLCISIMLTVCRIAFFFLFFRKNSFRWLISISETYSLQRDLFIY